MVMLVLFMFFAGFWLRQGSFFSLSCGFISQVPFWIGSMIFVASGQTPVEVNIITDLAASTAFVWLAYRFRETWLIILGVLFLLLGITDVYAAFFGMMLYFELHVAMHILALIVIAGRKSVDRIYRPLRNRPSSVPD